MHSFMWNVDRVTIIIIITELTISYIQIEPTAPLRFHLHVIPIPPLLLPVVFFRDCKPTAPFLVENGETKLDSIHTKCYRAVSS